MDKFIYKYRVYITIFLCLCCFGIYKCSTHYMIQNTEINDSIDNDTLVETKVIKFSYNGDNFIEFVKDDNVLNVIHDPKCKCSSNKLNNITTYILNHTNDRIDDLDENNRKNFKIILDKLTAIQTEQKILVQKLNNQKKIVVKRVQTRKR